MQPNDASNLISRKHKKRSITFIKTYEHENYVLKIYSFLEMQYYTMSRPYNK